VAQAGDGGGRGGGIEKDEEDIAISPPFEIRGGSGR
jgi:hypothetical protein